ncbi:chemotaxis protein CheW [Massilia sp. G4R7]|uniref:Chemotaxis protein CheW n=1 Tax=Massilia phyllostachyos TaxID=2898585 RepID=A0ABS8Q746_9BURK|nr:chemotaxis protein CheW [Massilia phyllostachyos]MCD2517577.1 chemotaxis protein CheW [Massilia phyllostachyos]
MDAAKTTEENEVLSFRLAKEEYAISILKVQEIRGYEEPTLLPSAPACIKGIQNLRGSIVPIVDMRILFKLGEPTYDQFTVVIVLNIKNHVIGMVVDSVSDVVTLEPEQVRAAPEMGTTADGDYITGLGTVGERMLILLDIDRLMSSEQLGLIQAVKQAA